QGGDGGDRQIAGGVPTQERRAEAGDGAGRQRLVGRGGLGRALHVPALRLLLRGLPEAFRAPLPLGARGRVLGGDRGREEEAEQSAREKSHGEKSQRGGGRISVAGLSKAGSSGAWSRTAGLTEASYRRSQRRTSRG